MKAIRSKVAVSLAIGTFSLISVPRGYSAIPPELMLSDGSGDTVTIDSTGAVTCTGSCSAGGATVAPGSVQWAGTIGAFRVDIVVGQTKPALPPPEIELTFLIENDSATPGTITVQFTDTGFSGLGPASVVFATTPAGSTSTTFTSYVDNSNAPFGTGTLVGMEGPYTSGTFQAFSNLPGPTAQPYSMTNVVTTMLGPSSSLSLAGFGLAVTPTAPPQLTITKVPDNATVTAGGQIGFTVTISNTGVATATGLTLTDPLPPGGNEMFNWSIDTTAGNPSDFTITGSPGSQSLVFSPAFLASPDSLAVGQSISVHITSPTTVGDVSGGAVGLQSGVSSSAYLGAAGNYGVLYMVGSGTHNLSITNVTLGANIGVGSAVGGNGVGNVSFSGPGIITGRLDFAPGQTNQFSNSNGSNVGPASVNKNVAGVASAISTVTSLNSALGALTGTPIAINGTQTINESAGMLHTVNGVTYSVFTVTSYSENDGKILTINGNGSGNPVVFNFPNGNFNLGSDVALTGDGLNDDKVIWNFTSSNQNIQLNNNASSYPSVAFHGIILAPNDGIHLVNANLSGRIFGGDNQDMQLVSGLSLHAPIMNTATVSGSNVTSASSSATITVTGPFLPYAHFI